MKGLLPAVADRLRVRTSPGAAGGVLVG